jgi:hypothetical protein
MSLRNYTNVFIGASALLLLVTMYLAATSSPPTIEYTELEIIMDTPKDIYIVGEAINATVYLRNTKPDVVYVQYFGIDFTGYTYEGFYPAHLGHAFGGSPIEILGKAIYREVPCFSR